MKNLQKNNVLAQRIAKKPPKKLRMSKQLLREGMHSRLDSLLELSASYQGSCHQTADHVEAVDALLEKRDTLFNGT